VLYYGDFLVLDSALLGEGLYGRGTFRLNPGSDSIHVRTTGQYPPDWLFYGPGHPLTPAPSLSASTSVWNEACYENQSITYYADSTPTPGHENDDFCSISGTVATQGGESLSYAAVTASGQHGQASACSWDGNRYAINGLQPGVYWVGCDAHMLSGAQYYATYPDSVVVGYSQYVTGIDFLFPPTGVAEQPGPAGQRSEPGPTVLPDAAKLVLYDVRGRRVRNPGPGVYFVRELVPGSAGQYRMRKLIIAR